MFLAASSPLLNGPIPRTLLHLALPNVLAMVTTVLVGIAETSYIGLLGVEPLAAMALVFPFVMLTQMMSSGAMGGGVSSAVSRALGAGNTVRAEALALHAVLIGTIAGGLFALFFLMFGPRLYALLGGRERVLAEAIGYSSTFFAFAAITIWLNNSLLSVVRGTGNMVLPSAAVVAVSIIQIALGGALGLGLGPFPQLGMPGVALGQALATATGVVFALWYLTSGRARVRLRLRGIWLQWDMFADILKVGALACLSPLQSVLTILIFTALVARFGVSTLAGYGIGVRLEFLLVPIAFGIGVASVPMVGMAIGATDIERARRVAWTAGAMSGGMLGVIGAAVAIAPDLWASIFTRDPAVLAETRNYLRLAGPGFAFLGLGLTLYFASQGSGKVLGPVIAGTLRLVLVALGGLWLVQVNAGANVLFALVGISMAAYGIAVAIAVALTPWGPRPLSRAKR